MDYREGNMKLAMYRCCGRTGIAVCQGTVLHGLDQRNADYPGDLDALVSRGADLCSIGTIIMSGPALNAGEIEFLPPLAHPSKILCVGLNYRDHSTETGMKLPEYPTIFARFPSCLIGHGQPIVKPKLSDQLDYEGELAAVIGKKARCVAKEKALEYVAAYSLFNDVSIRDYQMKTTQWTMGKNFDGTGAFGPWLATPEELPPGAAGLRLTTRLNGETVQNGSTSDMIFSVADLIFTLSQAMTLEPGDVIVTGTPAGVGMARKPPLYMKAGDVCEVDIEGIGVLRNPVVEG